MRYIPFPSHPPWLSHSYIILETHTYYGNISDKHNFNIFRFKTKVLLMSGSRHFLAGLLYERRNGVIYRTSVFQGEMRVFRWNGVAASKFS